MVLLNKESGRRVDRIAFRDMDPEGNITDVTYRQFIQDVGKCVSYYHEMLEKTEGVHFGLFARAGYMYIVCMYAVWEAGGVLVPLNIQKSSEEIEHELQTAEVQYLICDEELEVLDQRIIAKYTECILRTNGFQSNRVCSEGDEHNQSLVCTEWNERYQGTVCTKEDEKNQSRVFADWNKSEQIHPGMIMFTSGSLGISKGTAVSHRALEANADSFHEYFEYVKNKHQFQDIDFLFCLPIYHMFGFSLLTACIASEYTVSLCSDIRYMLLNITGYQSNCTGFVPVMLHSFGKMIKAGRISGLGHIKEVVCAGAMCSPEILELYLDHGIDVTKDYGLTEISTATINMAEDRCHRIHSVGRVFGDTRMKIEDGEVLFQGSSLMDGYYNNSSETEMVIHDGWFHTGDLGYQDEEGYLFLTGRKKNLIILSSGENVSPEELEQLLLENEVIEEAVVKEKAGQICAEIYCCMPDKEKIEECIRDVNRKVAIYKRITMTELREVPFPKTSTGKIRRF